MKTITIIAQKGGNAKTTTCHALGTGLKILRDKKVLFIDLDPQQNLTFLLQAEGKGFSVLDVLKQDVSIDEAIIHTPQGDIVRACQGLSGIDTALNENVGSEYKLREAIEELKTHYDYCFIDTPPQLGTLNLNALTACNEALIPCQADAFSIQGLKQLKRTIESIRKYSNQQMRVGGVIVSRYNSRTTFSKEAIKLLEETAKELETKVFKSYIRECIAIKEAQGNKDSIFTYLPDSNGRKDFLALLEEVF